MNYYAQIDITTRACQSVMQASEPLDGLNLIAINSLDGGLLGKIHNAATGAWENAPVPDPVEDPRQWWLDVGPFYDRFGPDALAIAASDHGACKAVQTLTGVRKYIDLQDPRIGSMIDMLIATSQPTAVAYAPGSGPMTAAKKAAILSTPTTEYERHIKGL